MTSRCEFCGAKVRVKKDGVTGEVVVLNPKNRNPHDCPALKELDDQAPTWRELSDVGLSILYNMGLRSKNRKIYVPVGKMLGMGR